MASYTLHVSSLLADVSKDTGTWRINTQSCAQKLVDTQSGIQLILYNYDRNSLARDD